MEELAKDKTAAARALSTTLLGDGTDPGDRIILEEALKDKSWLVRAAAAEALGHVGDETDVEKLAAMMEERYRAAAGDCAIDDAVTRVKPLLYDPQNHWLTTEFRSRYRSLVFVCQQANHWKRASE